MLGRIVRPDGTTSFSMIQLASDSGNAAALVFFLFDLLYLVERFQIINML